jgi:hypothetical protein
MPRKRAGQKHGKKIANRSFECVWQIFGTTITDQNYMQEEIKSRPNSGMKDEVTGEWRMLHDEEPLARPRRR